MRWRWTLAWLMILIGQLGTFAWGVHVGAKHEYLYCYNGATWDRCRERYHTLWSTKGPALDMVKMEQHFPTEDDPGGE